MGKYFFFKKGSLERWFSGTKACTPEGHPWGHVKSPLFCDTSIPRARWEVEPEISPRGSRDSQPSVHSTVAERLPHQGSGKTYPLTLHAPLPPFDCLGPGYT